MRKRRKRDEATAWLRALLEAGSMNAGVIEQKATVAGLNYRTVQRAARDMGVRIDKSKAWRWELPHASQLPVEGDKATTDAAVAREIAKLRAQFWDQVRHQVNAELTERKAQLDSLEQNLNDTHARLEARLASVVALLSYEEYCLVRSCLHPDRAPADRVERFTAAFQIFQRFEATANPKLPIAYLRRCGWDHISPYRRR
jgi:hypothetical protein